MLKRIAQSKIAQNTFYLTVVQIAGAILPLISIPYLTRTLSVEHWGLFTFYQMFGVITAIFMEYGFGLSAVRSVAQAKDQAEIRSIFSNVMSIKFLISMGVIPIMLSLGYLFTDFAGQALYLWGAGLLSFFNGMNSLWIFHGKENLGKPSAVFLIGAACYTLTLFFIVTEPEHGWRALFTQLSFNGLSTLFLFSWAIRDNGWEMPQVAHMKRLLKEGWSLFISRIAVLLYSSSFTFILGVMTAPVQVGMYTGAEKLFRAMHSMLSPLSLAIFPRMNQLLSEDFEKGRAFLRRMSLLMFAVAVVLATGLWLTADWFIPLFLGDKYIPSIPLFKIGIAALPFVALNTALGTQWLVPLGLDGLYNKGVITLGLSNLFLLPVLILWKGATGAAIGVLATEFLSAVIFMFLSIKARKRLF